MKILVTGGSGVLGRAAIPHLEDDDHQVVAPRHDELDLFDQEVVGAAMNGVDAVFHLATRIPPRGRLDDPEAWKETDRLRREATSVLVAAASAADVELFLYPSVAFVYPPSGPVDESTPLGDMPENIRSTVDAERHVARFADRGRRGVVLRFGNLYGPGTRLEKPAEVWASFGATVRIEDAGEALVAALGVPSGIYNVVNDGERVSNARFKRETAWQPARQAVPPAEAARVKRSGKH